MTRKEMLRNRLEDGYRRSRFHSFLGSLKGVTENGALWVPERYRGFAHMTGSILNLGYHAAGDKHVLMSVAFGDGSRSWPEVESLFQQLGGDLAAVRALAQQGHDLVLAALYSVPEDALDAPRPYYGGKSLPAAEVFAIVAEHDVYHAGQIWYVRNLLAGRSGALSAAEGRSPRPDEC